MSHFPGFTDPSHYQRDGGFFGTRATLAATARDYANATGQVVRSPRANDGPVGYGQAPHKSLPTDRTHTFHAPPPAPHTQNYSAHRQNAIADQGLASSVRVPLAVDGGFGASTKLMQQQQVSEAVHAPFGRGSFGASPTRQAHQTQSGVFNSSSSAPSSSFNGGATGGLMSPSGQRDLWNAPVLPHGDRSSYSATGTAAQQQQPQQPFATSSARFGQSGAAPPSFSSSSLPAQLNTRLTGVVDPAFVDAPDAWRYDARGVAMAKNVELRRNTDPRQKYLIPGHNKCANQQKQTERVQGCDAMRCDTCAALTGGLTVAVALLLLSVCSLLRLCRICARQAVCAWPDLRKDHARPPRCAARPADGHRLKTKGRSMDPQHCLFCLPVFLFPLPAATRSALHIAYAPDDVQHAHAFLFVTLSICAEFFPHKISSTPSETFSYPFH